MVTFIVEMRLIAYGQPHQMYQVNSVRVASPPIRAIDRCLGIAPTRFYRSDRALTPLNSFLTEPVQRVIKWT